MTVEQYLRDKIAKKRAQTPVTFCGTDPTNLCNMSYGPIVHMYVNQDTFMRQSNSGGHNDNSSDKTHTYIRSDKFIYIAFSIHRISLSKGALHIYYLVIISYR